MSTGYRDCVERLSARSGQAIAGPTTEPGDDFTVAAEACSTEEKVAPYQRESPVRDGAASSPRVPCLEGSVPPHNRPYLLAKPPPGRRHPVKAVSREAGRAMRASLEGMAPVWPHSYKQVTVLWTLISPAPVSCRNSIRCRRHRALCR
jgi:hypothetical protein